ncbi:hypothetical protein [Morganella psychrotolerans]|uniref:Uncharacterized protein n=1 Tax=Morganella psychrotolerans TaxID=368603 RepID=A0A1B8HKT2_9GAMM|nr:hypothetical protein [Morganella psychrotolerans]OBU09843.1 hypothetical protein AYY17_17750 [Morganella psychrotolerans]
MKQYGIEAERIGEVSIVTVSNGNLHATAECIGQVRRMSVTGRGNVRQIKTIAKIFQKTINA